VRIREGTVLYCLRDITERKQMEQQRDRMFSESKSLLCIAGFDGRFRWFNPAWERILGYAAEELQATPYLNLVHPDELDVVTDELEKLASGREATSFEMRCRCRDGGYKWILWNAIPILEES